MARQEFRLVNGITPETTKAIRAFAQRVEADARSADGASQRRGGGARGAIRAYWSRGEEDGWAPSWLRRQVEKELRLVPHALPPTVGHHLSRARSFSVSQARDVLNAPAATLGAAVSSTAKGAVNAIASASGASASASASRLPPNVANSPSPRKRTRPWHLRSARASRSIDGSIVIEPPDDFSETDTDKDAFGFNGNGNGDGTDGDGEKVAMVLEGDTAVPGGGKQPVVRAGEAGGLRRTANKAEDLLSSTVCEIGMPHAFCLKRESQLGSLLDKNDVKVVLLTDSADLQTGSKWLASPRTGSGKTTCRTKV